MKMIKSALRKCLRLFLRVFYKILRVEKIYRSSLVKDIASIPAEAKHCLVLGALLFPDETITPMLVKRLELALEVSRQRPETILVLSGDGSKRVSNDCRAMCDYVKQHSDIAAECIAADPEGFDTVSSLRNLKKRIGTAPFVLVTSAYHMPRAAYIAHRLGMKAYALDLPHTEERFMADRRYREKLAMVKTWFVLTFSHAEGPKDGVGKRLWYRAVFTLAKAVSKLQRLRGRGDSKYPGSLALQYCPYLFDHLTRHLPLTLVTGCEGKKTVEKQLTVPQGKKVFANLMEDGDLADIAAAMIRHAPFFGKPDGLYGVFTVREEDFYKLAGHCKSAEVSVYVTDIKADETVAHKKTHLIRERIKCGCELMPHAKVWLNSDCPEVSSLQGEIPNETRFYASGV